VLKSKLDTAPVSNDSIIKRIDSAMEGIDHLSLRIGKLEGSKAINKKDNLKKVILQDINSKSKGYIKNFIFSLIKKYNEISASQLKRIVVEEQSLCSKSTFYRILSELEQSEPLDVINTKKEKHFRFKLDSQT
tara:strand:- start:465 stop:863 length:399 start_codon:yes stop_codon:yes gene_type:complete